jgi:ABC-type Zn uptake system ZnuABC Zn-binding protein ZnuA
MKHYLFTLTLLLILGVSQAQDKIKIISSASMFTDMAENIMTDDFTISTIVPIGGDPHKYNARPSDASRVSKADIVLINGLTFEGWITELIENAGSKAKIVTLTDGVTPISSIDYANSSDPHAWMDAENALIYIKNIYDVLLAFKPDSKAQLDANYEKYKAEIIALDEEIQTKINSIPEAKRVLITSHDAFQYYGSKYGVQLEAIMGISTEAEAQTSDITRVSKVIKESKVPSVFVESTINPKMLKQIAKDNKVGIGGELFADSLDDPEKPAGTYIGMLRHNTNTIVEGLTKGPQEEIKEETKVDDLLDPKNMPLGLKIILGLSAIGILIKVILKRRNL